MSYVHHNILMLDFPKQRDLSDGSAGKSFIFNLDEHLLDGHILVVALVVGFEHQTICSLAYVAQGLPMLSSLV